MKFRIGIVMAGAVSAGAYTAGVIDYLLEALGRWEYAKQKNRELGKDHPEYDRSLPMHDVEIQVMGGASAGGMTAAITTLGLFKGITPVTKPNPELGANLIYDAWVNLNDNATTTIKQLLATDDLKGQKDRSVPSLLNAKAIWGIGEKAKEKLLETDLSDWKSKIPNYISSELEIILSLCSLRGIPVDVKFETEDLQLNIPKAFLGEIGDKKKEHRMYIHKWNAHFKLWDKENNSESAHTWKFNPNKDGEVSNFLSCAFASGAFPFGLRPIKVEQDPQEVEEEIITSPPKEYLKNQLDRLFHNNELVTPRLLGKDGFKSTIVDGGVVNNEPFVEVEDVLKDRLNANGDNPKNDITNYALLMIDPFPSNNDSKEDKEFDYTHPTSVEKLLGPLFSAVRRQAMVKESDIPDLFSLNITRGLIIPKKGNNKEYPIACGSLGGFGGFFSKKFREHDFFLGRKNCQSFLRKHFGVNARLIREDSRLIENERTFQGYAECLDGKNDPMYVRFAHSYGEINSYSDNPFIMYPIIPDTYVRHAKSKDKAYWDEKEQVDRAIRLPDNLQDPKISLEDLRQLQKPLRKRINCILNTYLRRLRPRIRWPRKRSVNKDIERMIYDVQRMGIDLDKIYSRKADDYRAKLRRNPEDSKARKKLEIVNELLTAELEKTSRRITKRNFSWPLWIALRSVWGIILIIVVMIGSLYVLWEAINDTLFYGSTFDKALELSLNILLPFMFFLGIIVLLLGFFKSLYVASLTRKIFKAIVGDFYKRGLLEGEK